MDSSTSGNASAGAGTPVGEEVRQRSHHLVDQLYLSAQPVFIHTDDPARLCAVSEEELDGLGPGSYAVHEALDRVALIERLIDGELAEHPAIIAHPQWLVRVDAICMELARLYQEIGAVHLA